MENLEALFSGASILDNTSDTVKVTMNNGVAILHSVEEHTSKKGNKCAKLVFRTLGAPNDETKGHIEYVSLSDGARFARVISKLVYLAVHSSRKKAIEAFRALPNAVTVLKNEQGQPLVFSTNDELEGIREAFGENTTFIWMPEDAENRRVAIQFNQPEAYIYAFIAAMNRFVGEKYMLEVKKDDRGFQQLTSIGAMPKKASL